jgi:glycosyltransferase involved in cell wall biosynthesis
MKPTDELADLVIRGIALAEQFPDPHDLASARERFTERPDLHHLDRPSPQRGRFRMGLPIEGRPKPKRPPAVAIVTPDIAGPIRNGGIGTAYSSLAALLASAGHDVTILYTLGDRCEDGQIRDWTDRYNQGGIRFVPLPAPDGPANFIGPHDSHAAYRWLATRIFDVVHFPEWNGTAFCSVQAKRLGLAFANTVICVGVHSPSLWHDLEDRRTIDRIEQLEVDFLERRSVAWADIVISPSQYLFQWMDRWNWTIPDHAYVQPYVSQPLTRRNMPGERVPVSELVFFGRIESRKGVEIFCDAVDRLSARQHLDRFKVTFLGKSGRVSGSDGLRYVRERASAWTHQWQTLEDFTREEAIDYLASRPALSVMPSVADNTPNTILECLQVGLPFVASTMGGIPEMISPEDHEHALIRPEPDVLAQAIAERLADGAIIVHPATDQEVVARQWVGWHEEQVNVTPEIGPASGSSSRPLVTVCMATHDRPAFLAQALDSIRRQTYENFEVVLVDDGSQTDIAKIELDSLVDEFRARGWTLLRRPRMFPGAARNAAAVRARGRYLVFMDDDNLAFPTELATFVRSAEYSGAAILTCAHDAFEGQAAPASANLTVHRWMPFGGAYPLAFFLNRVGDTNMCIRREAFFAVGGFDEERGAGLFEDWAFFAKATVRGFQIEVVPEPLYLYRLGAHGFGQRSPSHHSYCRSLGPFLDLVPQEVGLAVLYAAGAFRRSLGDNQSGVQILQPNRDTRMSRMRLRDRVHSTLIEWLQPSRTGIEEGEHLADLFARAAPVAVIGPTQSSAVVPLYQVQIHQSDGALRVVSLGDEPQLQLGHSRSSFFTRGPLLVRLDITTPRDTVAQLFWKTVKVPVYCEQHSVRTRLEPGRNIKYLRVPAEITIGRIRLDPATFAGELMLHGLQVRRENTSRP